jgi:hypothetical protein
MYVSVLMDVNEDEETHSFDLADCRSSESITMLCKKLSILKSTLSHK